MSMIALQILLLLVLILCSAFFSGGETALFSLGRARLLQYAADPRPDRQRVAALMRTYGRTLIALVAGNMFVNTGLSVVSAELIGNMRLSPNQVTLISIIMTLVVLLLFGEIMPKAVSLQFAEPLSLKASSVISGVRLLMAPMVWMVEQVSSRVLDVLGRRHSSPLRPEEYGEYIDLAHTIGAFSVAETNLLSQVFMLRQRRVNRIMIQRIDVPCVRRELSPVAVAEFIRSTRQPFYPVVDTDIDETEVILSVRDFFALSPAERVGWASSRAVLAAVVIPENTSLTRALETLREHATPVALVADEYGGIVGLISRQRIFEEIVGDIDDEYDAPAWQIRRIAPGVWRVGGQMPLDVLHEMVPSIPPLPPEAHTVNGLFALMLGRIPEVGDRVSLAGAELHAVAVDRQRVAEAELQVVSLPSRHEENAS